MLSHVNSFKKVSRLPSFLSAYVRGHIAKTILVDLVRTHKRLAVGARLVLLEIQEWRLLLKKKTKGARVKQVSILNHSRTMMRYVSHVILEIVRNADNYKHAQACSCYSTCSCLYYNYYMYIYTCSTFTPQIKGKPVYIYHILHWLKMFTR